MGRWAPGPIWIFGEKKNRLPLLEFETRIVQQYKKNYLKIIISNFYATKFIVVLNSRVALPVAGQDSFLASNKIVQPLRFLHGRMEKNYKKNLNIILPLMPRSV